MGSNRNVFPQSAIRISYLLLLLTLLLAGCARGPRVTVPLQENAEKQYGYALQHRANSNLILITDKDTLKKERAIAREHFRKVVEFFPNDRKATPMAKLEMLEMDASLDTSRIEVAPGQLRDSIRQFQKLAGDYPEFEFIQAKTLLDQGLCYNQLHDFAKAMASFQQLRDKFAQSTDKHIRDLSRLGAYFYNQSHVND